MFFNVIVNGDFEGMFFIMDVSVMVLIFVMVGGSSEVIFGCWSFICM